jgi:hypothetical protein
VSMRKRLARLERLVDGLVRSIRHRCMTCGRGAGPAKLVVLLEGEAQLQHCAACGLPIGGDGVAVGSIGPSGECRLKIVRLEEEPVG